MIHLSWILMVYWVDGDPERLMTISEQNCRELALHYKANEPTSAALCIGPGGQMS